MKFAAFLIALAGAYFAYTHYYGKPKEDPLNPVEITQPTYAEIRLKLKVGPRDIDQAWFVATASDAECREFATTRLREILRRIGPELNLSSADCKAQLDPRHMRFFRNEPSQVTYLSMSRGDPTEREMRMINWGVTAEESSQICQTMTQLRQNWKGTVQCVRARPG